jgi:hypothetical protein
MEDKAFDLRFHPCFGTFRVYPALRLFSAAVPAKLSFLPRDRSSVA